MLETYFEFFLYISNTKLVFFIVLKTKLHISDVHEIHNLNKISNSNLNVKKKKISS